MQNPSLVSLNNNSQINLVNRYKKEALSRDPDAKGKCAPLGSSVQEMTPEQIEWEEILNKFRKWRPNPLQFEEMSVLFEDIVKLIMKKELELSELHKKLIISEEHHLKESLSMFNEVQRESKNNEEMLEHTTKLHRLLAERERGFAQLRKSIELYQYHLREHEACESKLIQASESNFQRGVVGVSTLESSDVGLWNE